MQKHQGLVEVHSTPTPMRNALRVSSERERGMVFKTSKWKNYMLTVPPRVKVFCQISVLIIW